MNVKGGFFRFFLLMQIFVKPNKVGHFRTGVAGDKHSEISCKE